MITDLQAQNVSLRTNDESKWKIKDLQELATTHDPPIETSHSIERIVSGWEGKAKGLMRVLWERGWINELDIDQYMKHSTDYNYSLESLMESCLDFANEITELVAKGNEFGVQVIVTPNYHAEIAGEGIEYSWGIASYLFSHSALDFDTGLITDFANIE